MSEKTQTYSMSDLKVVIPDHVYRKIMHWINKTELEVSGFGSLDWDDSTKTFTVRDAILLKQEVGASSTEIDAESLGKAMYRTKDEPNSLKWHWHSHVNMDVFWSSDDRELIASLGTQGWILATVFNKKLQHRSMFMSRTEVMGYIHDFWADELKTTIVYQANPEQVAQWDKEYDENVTAEKSHSQLSLTDKKWEKRYPYSPASELDLGYGSYEDYSGMIDTNDDRRWAKKGRPKTALFKVDFEDDGFALVTVGPGEEDYVYNPVYDKELKNDMDRFAAIADMDWKDIDFMREASTPFEKLLNRYLAWMATPAKREGLEKTT